MEKGITTGDVHGSRGVKPNAEVQLVVAQLWDTIRKAGEILVTVRSDNAVLSAKLTNAQGELHSYSERIAGLDEEREQGRVAIEERDQAVRTLREALEQAEKTALGQRAMMEEYADRLERYEETIRRLTTQVDVQTGEIEQLQQQNSEYEARHAEAERHHTEAQTLTQTVASLQKQLAVVTKKADDADYLRAEVVRRNTEMHARMKETLEYKERAAELENKIFEFGTVQAALRQAKEELQAARGECTAALLARDDAEQRAEHAEAQCAELRALVEESRVSESALQQRVQQLQDDGDTYRGLAEEEQERIVQLAEQMQQLQSAIPQYKEGAVALNERIAELQQQVEQAEREKEEATAQLQDAQRERHDAEKLLQHTKEECEQLRSTCIFLRQEVQDIAKGVVSKDFIEEKEAQLADLRTQLHNREQEVEKMQRQLDAAYTTGSLFSLTASASTRDTVIASVESLLHKVEHALESEGKENEGQGYSEK